MRVVRLMGRRQVSNVAGLHGELYWDMQNNITAPLKLRSQVGLRVWIEVVSDNVEDAFERLELSARRPVILGMSCVVDGADLLHRDLCDSLRDPTSIPVPPRRFILSPPLQVKLEVVLNNVDREFIRLYRLSSGWSSDTRGSA